MDQKGAQKFANPNETMTFEINNPFSDFSKFEQNVENIKPLTPDSDTSQMTKKLE